MQHLGIDVHSQENVWQEAGTMAYRLHHAAADDPDRLIGLASA